VSRIAYVNGRYLPLAEAAVNVEDRAYQFADGVYEVCAVVRDRIIDIPLHLDRLERSLSELRMAMPMSRGALVHVMREVVRRSRIGDGLLYLQVSRGVAPRNHAFPRAPHPGVVVTARRKPKAASTEAGVAVISVPDIRWQRCDIKSVSLLPNVLAKQQANDAGVFEAWQVDRDGSVTEGSATNAWIVDGEGTIRTRAVSPEILSGVTRLVLLDLARTNGFAVAERSFTLEEAQGAAEAFLTSTSNFVVPVIRIDGKSVGDGRVGPVTARLRDLYRAYVEGEAAKPL